MKAIAKFNNLINRERDNKGSVLITVLVAFFFVSVLVAIILSTVAVNFKMRAIDRKTKDEFYYAEKALNDIYTGIGQDCSKIMGDEYSSVLVNYKGATGTYQDEEKAYSDFISRFVSAFKSTIGADHTSRFDGYIVKDTHLKGNSNATSRAIIKQYGTVKYYSDSTRQIEKNPDLEPEMIHCIVIEDVKIQSNQQAQENIGYISEITTDIVIEVPKVSFFSVNSKVFDYALAANAGLEFGKGSIVKVNGNMYGGTLPFADSKYDGFTASHEYGGIYLKEGANVSVNDSEYVVSGGDISVDGGTLSINKDNNSMNNQIWFENLEINGNSKVDINGDVFAADDLQVNTGADGSNINISGSYYGYNNGLNSVTVTGDSKTWTLTTKKNNITTESDYQKSKEADGTTHPNAASNSSSVIMNSKNATVDMTNLKTLMLLGNAYVNHESKTEIKPGAFIGRTIDLQVDNGKIMDASMPESAALKASQNIILMPTEFLTVSNPVICTSGSDDPFDIDKSSILTKMNSTDWFGRDYIDSVEPYKIIKMKADNESMVYAYCYLNFKDDESKTEYVEKIVAGEKIGGSPTPAQLKKEILQFTEDYNGQIKIGNYDSDGNLKTRVYAKNAVLGFDGTDLSVTGSNANNTAFDSYSAGLYKRYRMLDTYLDSMQDFPMSYLDTKAINYQDFKKKDNELPIGRFFWMWGLRKAATADKIIAADPVAEKDVFGSNFIFLRTASDSGIDLSSALSGMTDSNGNIDAFIIVDSEKGGAHVTQNLSVNGFIVCNGKIDVADNKKFSVTYDSRLLNKRIEAEKKIVEDVGGYHDENNPSSNTAVNHLLVYYMMNANRALYANSSSYKMPKSSDDITNTNMKGNQDSNTETSYREYKYNPDTLLVTQETEKTDYSSFVYFENWKKGQQ